MRCQRPLRHTRLIGARCATPLDRAAGRTCVQPRRKVALSKKNSRRGKKLFDAGQRANDGRNKSTRRHLKVRNLAVNVARLLPAKKTNKRCETTRQGVARRRVLFRLPRAGAQWRSHRSAARLTGENAAKHGCFDVCDVDRAGSRHLSATYCIVTPYGWRTERFNLRFRPVGPAAARSAAQRAVHGLSHTCADLIAVRDRKGRTSLQPVAGSSCDALRLAARPFVGRPQATVHH